MTKFLEDFDYARDRNKITEFSCGNTYMDRYLGSADLIHDYYKHEFNIEVLRDEEGTIIVIAVTRATSLETFLKEYDETIDIPSVEIVYFAVKTEYQKKGIGPMIFEELLEKKIKVANSLNMGNILLDSVDEAIGFYEGFGFTKLTSDKTDYVNGMKLSVSDQEGYTEYVSEFDQ